jgi:hypothetical protein
MTILPRFSRTLAAVGFISFALTSFAATTTRIATISSATTDGSASSSTFQLSVTSGQLANALTTSSDIELSLALAPQASHRGLKASVYTVIVAGGKFFKLTDDGSYVPWNGTIEDLTPFATNQTLESANRFTLLDGKMAEAGSYLYFVAYGVEGESRLLFTPDPAQITVTESAVLPDDTTSVAAETFEEELESAVVQAKCILCHVEGGLARNSSLQFQRTNTASALNNFASLSAYIDEKGAELLLSKITGGDGHAGGMQLSQDSEGYQAFEQVIAAINELDNPTYYAFSGSSEGPSARQVSFLTEVTLEPRESTLRRATLLLQGRLPTEQESKAVASDAALRVALRNLMQGPEFRDFVVKATNDRLLINGSMFGPIDEGKPHFLTLRNFAYENRESPLLNNLKNRLDRAAYRVAGELVAHVIENGRPYTEILNADYTMVNPLLNEMLGGDAVFSSDDDERAFKPARIVGYYQDPSLKRLEGESNQQAPYEAIGDPVKNYPHAGILTDLGFLNRYPTTATNRNRARARWVFYHFLDIDIEKSSQRPTDEAALKDQNNPTMNNPNCTVCHAILDPVAGAFQNWGIGNLYRRNGYDTLDGFYKYPSSGGTLYREGDLWYRDMRSPGLFDVKITERDSTLAELAKLIVEEDGFYTAAPKFWWSAIFGEPMIERPAVESDQGYAEKYAAYSAQQSAVDEFAAILRRGLDGKEMLTEMLMSAWFSGEQSASTQFAGAHSLSYLGGKQLLDPEQLSKKTRALTGVAWRTRLTPQNFVHWPSENIGVLLGGIDGSSVTERAVELTPLLATLTLTHAAETSCLATIREFELPINDRLLFKFVDESTSPESLISEPIVVPSTGPNDYRAMKITADLPKGPASFRVSFTNDYCDYQDGRCIEDRNMYVKSLSITKPSGDVVPVSIRSDDIRFMNPGCRYFGSSGDGAEMLGWWGNCYAEFSVQLTEPGQHTFTAVLSADVPSITGGFAEGEMSAWSEVPLSEIQNSETIKIKRQIGHLYDRLLGESNETSPDDIDLAYDVYLASRQSWLENPQTHFSSCLIYRDGLILKEYLSPEEFNEVQFPQDNHSEWFQTDWNKIGKYHSRLLQDQFGAKYSWAAVMALILSNFHYLHE